MSNYTLTNRDLRSWLRVTGLPKWECAGLLGIDYRQLEARINSPEFRADGKLTPAIAERLAEYIRDPEAVLTDVEIVRQEQAEIIEASPFRKWRQEQGLGIVAAGEIFGVQNAAYSTLERGVKYPAEHHWARLSELTGKPVAWLKKPWEAITRKYRSHTPKHEREALKAEKELMWVTDSYKAGLCSEGELVQAALEWYEMKGAVA